MATFSSGRPQAAVEDEDCGSFIVVQRWSNEDEAPRTPPTPEEDELLMSEGDSNSKDMEGEEQFCDAAANLGSSETLTMTNVSIIDNADKDAVERSDVQGAVAVEPESVSVGVEVNMIVSQEDERFSMTNYSTASSTSEYQVEEQTQAKLNQLIADHKSLLELLEKQNLELEQRKMAIEELKLLANESVSREKEKSEESRRIVEKAIAERDLAVQQVETLKMEVEASAQAASTQFETLEPLERQLQQRDEIIQRNNEQIKELSTQLHEEILKGEELLRILQSKDEEDKKKNESLSSSDEALARAMSEKEELEEALQAAFKEKMELQRTVSALHDELQTSKNQNEQVQSELHKAGLKFNALDAEINDMRVKLAALQAEKERQEQSYRHEMEKMEEIRRENEGLRKELDTHRTMLQEKKYEIEAMRAPNPNSASNNGMAGSMFGGNLFGGLFKSTSGGNLQQQQARGFGIRDADDDPNEPYSDPAGDNASAGAQNNLSLEHLPLSTGSQQESFQCPICLKRFDRLRKLEFHASECGIEAATRTDPFVFP